MGERWRDDDLTSLPSFPHVHGAVIGLRHKRQVLDPVIASVVILVVDVFVLGERAADVVSHDESVFSDVPLCVPHGRHRVGLGNLDEPVPRRLVVRPGPSLSQRLVEEGSAAVAVSGPVVRGCAASRTGMLPSLGLAAGADSVAGAVLVFHPAIRAGVRDERTGEVVVNHPQILRTGMLDSTVYGGIIAQAPSVRTDRLAVEVVLVEAEHAMHL